jgi:AcrR family transcriptional regulator
MSKGTPRRAAPTGTATCAGPCWQPAYPWCASRGRTRPRCARWRAGAGVAPNAVYRHFENRAALFESIRAAALSAVAMENRLAPLGPERDTLQYARATLRAVGTAYLRFAHAETGLFRTAFAVPFDITPGADPRKAGRSGLNPFQLLGAALDRLVRAGALSAARRQGAEYVAWSAVHGMAMLSLDGPLRRLPARRLDALGQRLLDMVEQGIGVRPDS